MANLKGRTFKSQKYDAMHRLEARGTPRTGEARNDGLNHSHAKVEKSNSTLNDFIRYVENKGLEGKLNLLMTHENIAEFLRERTSGLEASTTEGYISNLSAMIKGLESKNITIPVAGEGRAQFFAELKNELGRTNHKEFERGRYINEDRARAMISSVNERSSAIMELQYRHGFRVSEAREIVNNSEKYLREETLSEVRGKTGQKYKPKEISTELREKIERSIEVVSKDKYYRDVAKVLGGNRAHDLRLSYSIDKYSELRNQGKSHSESMKATSEEVNHHRESMTEYYQVRG